MALDARTRSRLYRKLAPLLGDDDANVLMSQFPSVEAGELVTEQFLRAELAELRLELRANMSEVRTDMSDLRTDMSLLRTEVADRLRQQTIMLGGGLAGATAVLLAAIPRLA